MPKKEKTKTSIVATLEDLLGGIRTMVVRVNPVVFAKLPEEEAVAIGLFVPPLKDRVEAFCSGVAAVKNSLVVGH